jgi:hypothetical protein
MAFKNARAIMAFWISFCGDALARIWHPMKVRLREGGGLFKVLPSLVTDTMVLHGHLNATDSYSIEVNEDFMLLLQQVLKGTNFLPRYWRNTFSYTLSWPSYWCGAYEDSCKELGAVATVEMQLDVKTNPTSMQSHLSPGFGMGKNLGRTFDPCHMSHFRMSRSSWWESQTMK